MTCQLCGNKGFVQIGYDSEPESYRDFGVCLCPRGQRFRSENSMAAFAAKNGVSRERVNLIEELIDADDLPQFPIIQPGDDVTDAGRTAKRAKL